MSEKLNKLVESRWMKVPVISTDGSGKRWWSVWTPSGIIEVKAQTDAELLVEMVRFLPEFIQIAKAMSGVRLDDVCCCQGPGESCGGCTAVASAKKVTAILDTFS